MRLDASRYPVIHVIFPATGTDADIHVWYDEVERYLREADGKVAFIDDLRAMQVSKVTGAQRRIAAQRHDGLIAKFADKHAGNARIVGGPLAVAVLRIFDWLSPAPWPVASFDDEEAAFRWCEARIAEASRR